VDFFDPAPGPNQKKAQKKIPESCCDGLRQTLLPRPSVSSWFAPLLAPPLLPHISALAPFLTLNHVRCPFYAFQLSATAMNTRKHFAKKTNTKQILLTKTQQLGPLPLFAFIFLFYPLQFPPKSGFPLFQTFAIACKNQTNIAIGQKRDHASLSKNKQKKAACVIVL
jgi:hypothetical protein